MARDLAPPGLALCAMDLLVSLFLGGNRLTQSGWRTARGCCAMKPAGILWIPHPPCGTRVPVLWGGTRGPPAGSEAPAPAPLALPAHKAWLRARQR